MSSRLDLAGHVAVLRLRCRYRQDLTEWWDNGFDRVSHRHTSPVITVVKLVNSYNLDASNFSLLRSFQISGTRRSWSTSRCVTVILGGEAMSRKAGRGGCGSAPSPYVDECRNENADDRKLAQKDQVHWAACMSRHTKSGQGRQALRIYDEMRQSGGKPSICTVVAALKACKSIQDLESGKQIHAHVVEYGFQSDVFVGTALLALYAKCGNLVDARSVFESMPQRDVVTWNCIILGHAQMEEGEVALQFYRKMLHEGLAPNDRTFVAALKACCSLTDSKNGNQSDGMHAKKGCHEQVRAIHSDAVKWGSESDVFVGNMLVHAYAKCRHLMDARNVFEKMPRRNVVSWNTIIWGYAQLEEGKEALHLFERMQQEGVVPDDRTFVAALKGCSAIVALKSCSEQDVVHVKAWCLEQVRAIHSHALRRKCDTDVYIGNLLLDVFAKCGILVDARRVFDKMPHRNVESWNAMILGYAQVKQNVEALRLYAEMQQQGVVANYQTFLGALKACSTFTAEGSTCVRILGRQQCLDHVRTIHAHVLRDGLESDVFVGTMLVDVYAKCWSLLEARLVFEKLPHRDVVSWNAMILAYAHVKQGGKALELYAQMRQEGVVPNDRTFVSILKACSSLVTSDEGNDADKMLVRKRCLQQARTIHSHVVTGGYGSDVYVGNMLIDVYAKCKNLVSARVVFEQMPHRDVVSWNALILGYAQVGEGEEALLLYTLMQEEGVMPNDRTYVGALKACCSLAALEHRSQGSRNRVKELSLDRVRAIHMNVVRSGSEFSVFVGTMLVDAYSKFGSLYDARGVFEKMPEHDVASWNAMILGYAQMDEGEEALQLYAQMQREGVMPDNQTFLSVLKACGTAAGLEKGKEIHTQFLRSGLDATNSAVASGLIDMYGKCGSTVDAQQVFDALPSRDIVTWSALIAGYAYQGESERVFSLFERMKQEGMPPDSIIFLSVLTVCCYAGLVDTGQKYFESMRRDFGISPTIEHYTCMVDLLCRVGELNRAMVIAKKMPYEPDNAVWVTVLSGCRKWGNVELGRQAFLSAVRLDKNDAAAYVMMANIYAAAHMWESAKSVEAMRVEAEAWKQPG